MTTTYDAITGRAASFQDAVRKHARYSLARRWEDLNRRDLFLTTALAVRDSLIDGMMGSGQFEMCQSIESVCAVRTHASARRTPRKRVVHIEKYDQGLSIKRPPAH